MKRQTIQRVETPTAILVALPDPIAQSCIEALTDEGLRVLRVGHIAAANERIPVVMPQLVIVPANLGTADADRLTDRCVAVGAEVLRLAPDTEAKTVAKLVHEAANMAVVRALRRSE